MSLCELDVDELSKILGERRESVIMSLVGNNDVRSVEEDEVGKDETYLEEEERKGIGIIFLGHKKKESALRVEEFVEFEKVGGKANICQLIEAFNHANFRTLILIVGYAGEEIINEIKFQIPHIFMKKEDKNRMNIIINNLGENWQGNLISGILATESLLNKIYLQEKEKATQAFLIAPADRLYSASVLKKFLLNISEEEEYDSLLHMRKKNTVSLLIDDEFNEFPNHILDRLPKVQTHYFDEDDTQSPRNSSVNKNNVKQGDVFKQSSILDLRSSETVQRYRCQRIGISLSEYDAVSCGLIRCSMQTNLFAEIKQCLRRELYRMTDVLNALATKNELDVSFIGNDAEWLIVHSQSSKKVGSQDIATSCLPNKILSQREQSTGKQYETPHSNNLYYVKTDNATFVLALPAIAALGSLTPCIYVLREASVLLVPKNLVNEASKAQKKQTLLALSGLCEVSDVNRISISDTSNFDSVNQKRNKDPEEANSKIIVTIERRVPIIGWFMLIIASAAQASSFIASLKLNHLTPGNIRNTAPLILAQLFWRPMAATLIGIIIFVIPTQTFFKSIKTTLEFKIIPIAAYVSIFLLWSSIAMKKIARAQLNSGQVVYLWPCLTPICLLLFQDLFSLKRDNPPTTAKDIETQDQKQSKKRKEIIGALFALSGAFFFAYDPPDTHHLVPIQSSLSNNKTLYIFGMNMKKVVGYLFIALALCARCCSTLCKKLARNVMSGIEIYLLTQFGEAFISFLLLFFFDTGFDYHDNVVLKEYFQDAGGNLAFSFNYFFGAFGFLLFRRDRIAVYMYTSLICDTLGALYASIALRYVYPIMILMTVAFRPICLVFELWMLHYIQKPPITFYFAALCIVIGILFIVHTNIQPTVQKRTISSFSILKDIKQENVNIEENDGDNNDISFLSSTEAESSIPHVKQKGSIISSVSPNLHSMPSSLSSPLVHDLYAIQQVLHIPRPSSICNNYYSTSSSNGLVRKKMFSSIIQPSSISSLLFRKDNRENYEGRRLL